MWIADGWKDYELLDCGGGEKLERWGDQILVRPDPQAIWESDRKNRGWRTANARYSRSSTGGGHWDKNKLPESWPISYKSLRFQVKPMNFKHTGLFPEQAANWDFAMEQIRQAGRPIRVLNLFAYTGGASLAARAAGADVTHVDSVKPVVSWARENMEASGMDGIRWIVEDALNRIDGLLEKKPLPQSVNPEKPQDASISFAEPLRRAALRAGQLPRAEPLLDGTLRTAGPDGGPAARRRVLFGAVRRALLLRSFRQVASAGSLLPDVEAVTPGLSFSARASACTQACGSETGGSGTAETAVICREGMCRNAGGQSCDDYVFYVPTTTGPCMYAVRFGRTLSERSLDRSIRSRGNRNRHRYYGVYN